MLIPVLGRPHRIRPVLDSALEQTPDASVLFVASPDDDVDLAELKEQGADFITVSGNYAVKINQGIRRTTAPYIFTGADDLDFMPGWFEAAEAKMSKTVGLVGTQDLCNRRTLAGQHATHFLLARWYAELGTIDGQPGPLYEGYPHEYVDDEVVATAKKRRAWAFAPESIVEHLHPDVGKAPMDELYSNRPVRMWDGKKIFRERMHLWM